MHNNQIVTVYKALADPTRLALVRELATCPTAKKSCSDLSAQQQLSQPAMSHHFAKLVQAGVVLEQKSGTKKQYELNKDLLAECGINIKKLGA